ncbi:MAG: alanine racemase, partial [Clostridia bacterium]|nr:alanine racemase [Clostridia bacterium]
MKAEERAWAEIDLDAIRNNIRRIRDYVRPGTKILGAVKADGYGHGYLQVARTLLDNGADWLAVACIDEAVQLRRCDIRCPILILGHVTEQEAETVVREDITPACFSYELALSLSRAATKLGLRAKIHVKLDTGMGRVGLRFTEDETMNQETVDTILKMAVLPNLDIDGIFTHFSSADEGAGDEYTKMQFRRFLDACQRLKANGLEIPLRHCCNSAALIRFPEMHLDMVRPGIILYGMKPSTSVDCGRLHLKPAMQFKAKITHIKEVEPGVSVSYGRRFETERVTRIATIPVGYADGYSRILSGKSQVIAGGKICDVIGNICMDQC